MIKLSNHEKLLILYIKGHFSQYEDAMEIILSDHYAIPVESIGDVTRFDAVKRLFTKLFNNGYIPTGTLSTNQYLINLFTSNKTPYDAMFADIQWINVTRGLKEQYEEVDKSLEKKMTLLKEQL